MTLTQKVNHANAKQIDVSNEIGDPPKNGLKTEAAKTKMELDKAEAKSPQPLLKAETAGYNPFQSCKSHFL